MINEILLSLDDMKEELLKLEEGTNNIYDSVATYAFNKFMSELGNIVRVAPIYYNNKLIGAAYVNIQGKPTNSRYIIDGSIISLDGFESRVEDFIDKTFCSTNVNIKLMPEQNLNFNKLHLIKHLPKTVLIPIKESEEEQKKLLAKGRRRDITKALKNNLEVRELKDIEEYKDMFNLLNELAKFRGYKQDIDMQLLGAYYKELVPKRIAVAFGCFQGEDMIAADLVLFSKNRAREQIITEKPSKMDTGAQSYTLWKTINYCRQNNVKYLGLAGYPPEYSYMAGIGKFKKSFGGDVLNMPIYEENAIERLKQGLRHSPRILKFHKLYKSLIIK